MKKNKKNEMAALLATMVKDQTITPEIYFKGIRKMAEMERRIRVNPMYSRVLDEYALNLAHSSYMTTIYDYQIIKGEYYNPDCNGFVPAHEITYLSYDFKSNMFVYHHIDICCEFVEVNEAPEWFKSGWVGLTERTLNKEDFWTFYNKLCENEFFKLPDVLDQIKDFYEKNVAK